MSRANLVDIPGKIWYDYNNLYPKGDQIDEDEICYLSVFTCACADFTGVRKFGGGE